MELIDEYYQNREYDVRREQKFFAKHRKNVAWQKKIKTKASVSSNILSTKKIQKIKKKISKSIICFSTKSVSQSSINLDNEYKKIYSCEILDFNSKDDDGVSHWREQASLSLKKDASPIEKMDFFENRIRKYFDDTYQESSPDSTDVLEDVLNLMFQKAENSFTKTVTVNTKPINVVPESTAKYMNAKLSLWEQIQKLVQKDLKTVQKMNTMPKSVFGKSIQNNFKNGTDAKDFKSKWNSYSQNHVHYEELETFAAVWKNITHLQSTRMFSMWLANKPNIQPPAFLKKEGLLKDNLSLDYSARSDSMYSEYITPITIIDTPPNRRRTWLGDPESTSSLENSSLSSSIDISDINIMV